MKTKRVKAIAAGLTAVLLAGGILGGCGSDNTGSTAGQADTSAASGDTKVVKAVTGGSLAPYMYVDDNDELTGVDIDILKEYTKKDPLVAKLYEWVTDQFDNGRITMISDAEMEEQIATLCEAQDL